MNPTPVFDTYWRFAAERQAIFFRRRKDASGPWTKDPILGEYRFTNAYRILDRVSQYLVREVQYRSDRSQSAEEVFFRTILFKIFNKIETWEALERRLGDISWQATNISEIENELERLYLSGAKLYSAAYIMPAPKFGAERKYSNHLRLLQKMMADHLPSRIAQSESLSDVYEKVLRYSGLGKFLAFQYAIDLNYSNITPFDEGDFVVAGPGAIDGIAKCFTETGGKTPEEVIYSVAESQEKHFNRLQIDFEGIGGRRLQPIDCQNIFCEISKYARVAHPEYPGSSGRTRIKQAYRPSDANSHELFFPPKWNVRSTGNTFVQNKRQLHLDI